LANDEATTGTAFAPLPTSKEWRSTAKLHHQQIRVSPVVLDAARKDGEALLRDLGTSQAGEFTPHRLNRIVDL
jgi:hypothetical protein